MELEPSTIDVMRDADLADLAKVLESQRSRALDVVMPGKDLYFRNGLAVVGGMEPVLTEDGVTTSDGRYLPTSVGDAGLATKLGIPLAYVRRLRGEHLPLFDANVNGWLARDTRKFMLRLLRRQTTDTTLPGVDEQLDNGVLRAFVSDQYWAIDNFDVVMAALEGVQSAGIDPSTLTVKADLTERRMYVRVTSKEISANALALVEKYRDPASGRSGKDYPLLFAGLVISNSEVGEGGFSVVPRATFQVCTNGQTWTKDAERRVHIGGKLEAGVVKWSEETQRKALELVRLKTRDTVAAFMSQSYLDGKVFEMAREAGVVIEEPAKVVAAVSKRIGFTVEQSNAILNAFIDGGQRTAGGVMQAVTYVAQQTADGDVSAAMEAKAIEALSAAATIRV